MVKNIEEMTFQKEEEEATTHDEIILNGFYIYKGEEGEIVPRDATEVVIHPTVKVIKEQAFNKCFGLESITIPSSVMHLEDEVFCECKKLRSVSLPESVISIGNYVFYGCECLSSIKIPKQVITIGDFAFDGCKSLSSISLPPSITTIGNYAFYNCKGLPLINLPSSLTSIGNYAFSQCDSLQHINIPPSIQKIGRGAFHRTKNISKIVIPSCAEIDFSVPLFDSHTKVLRSYGWIRAGPCIMMRNRLEIGKAAPSEHVNDEDLLIAQFFIVKENDDIFRTILEFLVEHVEIKT